MAMTRTGKLWRGDSPEDLAACIRQHRAGGYPVQHVKAIICGRCRGDTFHVMVDDDEGCAVTVCLSCRSRTPLAGSGDHIDDADLGGCACPCGNETFTAAHGCATTADEEVRWISVGLRCPGTHLLADA
jgi:hypothetical protein